MRCLKRRVVVVIKWAYVLVFELEDSTNVEQFDKDVSKKICKVSEAYGASYELIPIPYTLVKCILPPKRCDVND